MRSFKESPVRPIAAVLGIVCLAAGCTASIGGGIPLPSSTGTSAAVPAGPSAPASGPSAPASRSAGPASRPVPREAISTAPAAAPVSPRLRTGAQAAATQAFGLYASGQFAAFWGLLSPATKRHISRSAWVGVHAACPSGDRTPGTVTAVTVFGNAAIVTETTSATPAQTADVVFNYVAGQWSYSPPDPSVYDHPSVAADVAAAKAGGLCGGWKIF